MTFFGTRARLLRGADSNVDIFNNSEGFNTKSSEEKQRFTKKYIRKPFSMTCRDRFAVRSGCERERELGFSKVVRLLLLSFHPVIREMQDLGNVGSLLKI